MDYIKPQKLNPGDTVALITLSWGGAAECMERYVDGKKQIEDTFGLNVIETPNALKPADWIYEHPQERMNDLMWAFQNKEVKAIISIIGGDDSIRLLDFLTDEHLAVIKENPKIFLGLSDTTIINFVCLKAGIVSFYGPSVLFGLAENGGIDNYTKMYLQKALFSNAPIGKIVNNTAGWSLDKIPWEHKYQHQKRRLQKPITPRFIQGQSIVEGCLVGGCLEVLELMKSTRVWPDDSMWDNVILFLETSEDVPSPDQVKLWLRNYGAQGVLKKIKGIMFGIPGGDIAFDDPSYEEKLRIHLTKFDEYDEVLLKVAKEYGRTDLVIVTHLAFGHTMPMFTVPYGIKIRLDPQAKELEIIENGVK